MSYRRPEEYVEHFYTLFEQAVSDRLRTDRISTHLSGGMDSTSVAAVAQQVLEKRGRPFDFQAFTLSSQEEPQEDNYTMEVASKAGIPLNFIAADGYFHAIPSLKPKRVLPESSLSIPERDPSYELTQRCAAHGRVVLTGFGGDPGLRFGEFYGVEWWKHGLIKQWLAVQLHSLSIYRRPALYLRQGWGYWRRINKQKFALPNYFNPKFVKQVDLQSRWEQINTDSLDKVARYGMGNSPYWSNLFASADPGYHGLPLKHSFPFFDLRLVSYLIAIPPVPWLVGKKILRDAMQQRLPETVRSRPKKVFEAPTDYSQVMQEMVKLWIGDLLKNTPGLDEYVDCSMLFSLLESGEEIIPSNRIFIERILTFTYWLNTQRKVNDFVSPITCKS